MKSCSLVKIYSGVYEFHEKIEILCHGLWSGGVERSYFQAWRELLRHTRGMSICNDYTRRRPQQQRIQNAECAMRKKGLLYVCLYIVTRQMAVGWETLAKRLLF
jgi:hypothetical protein